MAGSIKTVLGKVSYKTAERNGKSWRVETVDGNKYNIPDSLVWTNTPAIKILQIEVWFLKQEGIAFKLH